MYGRGKYGEEEEHEGDERNKMKIGEIQEWISAELKLDYQSYY